MQEQLKCMFIDNDLQVMFALGLYDKQKWKAGHKGKLYKGNALSCCCKFSASTKPKFWRKDMKEGPTIVKENRQEIST